MQLKQLHLCQVFNSPKERNTHPNLHRGTQFCSHPVIVRKVLVCLNLFLMQLSRVLSPKNMSLGFPGRSPREICHSASKLVSREPCWQEKHDVYLKACRRQISVPAPLKSGVWRRAIKDNSLSWYSLKSSSPWSNFTGTFVEGDFLVESIKLYVWKTTRE